MQMNSLDDFVKSIPDNANSIVKKVRHLYFELGKRSFYDPNYKYIMFGEEDIFSEYTYKIYRNPNIIICTTLAKQFAELLSKASITAEIIYEAGHYSVAFFDENGVKHLTDITNDLKNIQFGCRTSYFGTKILLTEQLEEIDLELGYITPAKGYTNDYWDVVRDTLQESNLSEKRKLEIVLQNLQKFGDITKLGDSEIFSIYQKFIRYCLPDTSGILFYSTKPNRYEREKCVVEFKTADKNVEYVLNPDTRLFDGIIELNKSAPTFSEGDER